MSYFEALVKILCSVLRHTSTLDAVLNRTGGVMSGYAATMSSALEV